MILYETMPMSGISIHAAANFYRSAIDLSHYKHGLLAVLAGFKVLPLVLNQYPR